MTPDAPHWPLEWPAPTVWRDDARVAEIWDSAGLSRRVASLLLGNGYETVGAARAATDSEFCRLPGFGGLALREVRMAFGQERGIARVAAADPAPLQEAREGLVELESQLDRVMAKLGPLVDTYRATRAAAGGDDR